jgi:chromosome partitioning protein
MYDNRRVLNRDVMETIHKHFGEKVYKTMIRENVALAEAPARQSDIFSYAPKSSGASDYLLLAKEIISRINGKDFEPEAAVSEQEA